MITMYKTLIHPHLDFDDILYDQAHNTSFHQTLESLQGNAYELLQSNAWFIKGETIPRTMF